MSFGWLHFTDLHVGQPGDGFWSDIKRELVADLEWMHECSGPWEFLFFTGDLTYSGTEFTELSARLDWLLDQIQRLGSRPLLLCVPGNHDLKRPDFRDPLLDAAKAFHSSPHRAQQFWQNPNDALRRLVEDAFAGYEKWHSERPVCSKPGFIAGTLPGDFSIKWVGANGVRVGVVGLNSSFLHLGSDFGPGSLALRRHQLDRVTMGDAPGWLESNDLNFLMTHHPVGWLHGLDQDEYQTLLAPAGAFDMHFFGHMHDPEHTPSREDGAPLRRQIQGASLFGLAHFGGGRSERIHGYSAGRIDGAKGASVVEIWPRRASRPKGSGWKLGPDLNFNIDRRTGSYRDPGTASTFAKGRCRATVPPSLDALRIEEDISDESDLVYILMNVKDCATSRDIIRQGLSRLARSPGELQSVGLEKFAVTGMYDLEGKWDLLVRARVSPNHAWKRFEGYVRTLVSKQLLDSNAINVVRETLGSSALAAAPGSGLGGSKPTRLLHVRLQDDDVYESARCQRSFLYIRLPNLHTELANNDLLRLVNQEDEARTALEQCSRGDKELVLEFFTTCHQSSLLSQLNRRIDDQLRQHELRILTLRCFRCDEVPVQSHVA